MQPVETLATQAEVAAERARAAQQVCEDVRDAARARINVRRQRWQRWQVPTPWSTRAR